MKSLLDNLRAFNSKERFFLVGHILGNDNFKICEDFRRELDRKLHLSVPSDAFSAMDYHIDWIYASLELAKKEETTSSEEKHPLDNLVIKGQQEDIDWLIAYFDGSKHHIILIEAKGVTRWNKTQMQSKIDRFKAVFKGSALHGVIPYLVLMSPRSNPPRLADLDWPDSNAHRTWIELKVPVEQLRRVCRCDRDIGKPDMKWKHWKVGSRI